jgi:hypothetical protein
MDSLATRTYNADNTLGVVSDTTSLAYALDQAGTNATNAAADAATARSVAVKMVNNYLVNLVSTVNSLNSSSITASSNATTAAADAAQAKADAASLL